MKRVDFIKHLNIYFCFLYREGANHSIFINPVNNYKTSIPRQKIYKTILVKRFVNNLIYLYLPHFKFIILMKLAAADIGNSRIKILIDNACHSFEYSKNSIRYIRQIFKEFLMMKL
jgi:hypothetical protein